MAKKAATPTVEPFVISSLETYILCAAMIAGLARWEPFPDSDDRSGEVCVDGLRYCTRLNKFGVPQLDMHLSGVLGRVLSEHGWVDR